MLYVKLTDRERMTITCTPLYKGGARVQLEYSVSPYLETHYTRMNVPSEYTIQEYVWILTRLTQRLVEHGRKRHGYVVHQNES